MTPLARWILIAALVTGPAAAWADPCSTAMPRPDSRAALTRAAPDHAVHVEFRTRAAGVRIPFDLAKAHPDTMTIVLQHEFDRLTVTETGFEVGLWFDRRYKWLAVPFEAVTGVWDAGQPLCWPN